MSLRGVWTKTPRPPAAAGRAAPRPAGCLAAGLAAGLAGLAAPRLDFARDTIALPDFLAVIGLAADDLGHGAVVGGGDHPHAAEPLGPGVEAVQLVFLADLHAVVGADAQADAAVAGPDGGDDPFEARRRHVGR